MFINHVAMIAVSDNENHCHCILFVQDASLNHIFMKVVYLHETKDILAVDKNCQAELLSHRSVHLPLNRLFFPASLLLFFSPSTFLHDKTRTTT